MKKLKIWDEFKHEPTLIRKLTLATPPPEWQEPDLYDYGVERLLIVDQRLLVDLLVKNGVHAQERALIIALEEGHNPYPDYLVKYAQQHLDQQPNAKAYLLHGSAPDGLDLARRTSEQFVIESDRILDLGLTPSDVDQMKGLRQLADQNSELPADYLTSERLSQFLTACFAASIPLSMLLTDESVHAAGFVDGDFG